MSRIRNKVGTFVFSSVAALYFYATIIAELQLYIDRNIVSGIRATIYALTGAATLMTLTSSATRISDVLTGILMLVPASFNFYTQNGSDEEICALLVLSLFGLFLVAPDGWLLADFMKPFLKVQVSEPILPQYHQAAFIDAKPQ